MTTSTTSKVRSPGSQRMAHAVAAPSGLSRVAALCLPGLALGAFGCAPTFLERAAAVPGSHRMPSGGIVQRLTHGEGPTLKPDGRATVAYEARFPSGKTFATSRDIPGGAIDVPVSSTSRCWREALLSMQVGDKARVTCVSDIAHGDAGPEVPPSTTVAFDLELLALGGPGSLPLPPGMIYKVLKPGSGERPGTADRVKVNYEGKLDDGTVFDSSIERGRPAEFPLGGVISCWRYGMQKMQVGEKASLVCPPDIAYGAKGSPPAIPPNATLHFEVELLGIEHPPGPGQ